MLWSKTSLDPEKGQTNSFLITNTKCSKDSNQVSQSKVQFRYIHQTWSRISLRWEHDGKWFKTSPLIRKKLSCSVLIGNRSTNGSLSGKGDCIADKSLEEHDKPSPAEDLIGSGWPFQEASVRQSSYRGAVRGTQDFLPHMKLVMNTCPSSTGSDAGAYPIICNHGLPPELHLDLQQREASFPSGQVPDLDSWGSDALRLMAKCRCSALQPVRGRSWKE